MLSIVPLLGDVKQRVHLVEPKMDGMIIRLVIFKIWDGKFWTEFIWLRIGISGGLL